MSEYCTKCGSEIKQNGIFCSKCGVKIDKRASSKRSKITVFSFILILVSIVLFIIWRCSPYWPWPTDDEKEERLQRVADVCGEDVYSEECKKLKHIFGASFSVCKRYTRGLNSGIFGDYDGIYGVAWYAEDGSPENKRVDTSVFTSYTYKDCTSY